MTRVIPAERFFALLRMTRATEKKTKVQSQIPVTLLVEQKTGILAVLSTPLLELPIQKKAEKRLKFGVEAVS